MGKSNNKIDEHGNYCPFPGITVIAGILDKDVSLWRRVNDVLGGSELIRHYFSALPYESYHMTTTDLFTEQYDGGNDWEAFVHENTPLFQALHAKLEEKKITPQIKIQNIFFGSVIQLVLSLPEEQRHQINEIAKEFGLENKVPRAFHMTLAYQYQPFPANKADADTTQLQIQQHIRKQLDNLFKIHNYTIELKSPELSTFHDMTSFQAWDGEKYPFDTTHSTHKLS